VGAVESGRHLPELAREERIAARSVQDDSLPTTLKMRVMRRQQQLIRVDFEDTPSPSSVEQLCTQVSQLGSSSDMLVLSDYAKGALGQVEKLIDAAKAARVLVLVDPKGHSYKRYAGATIITPNRAEMMDAVGRWSSEEDLERRAQQLRRELELEALLVTRSEQGMTLFTGQGREHIDAQAHEVFDVSGAGDTVLAALAVTRAAGLSWGESMAWANRAGGVVVGKLGTSVVTAGELT